MRFFMHAPDYEIRGRNLPTIPEPACSKTGVIVPHYMYSYSSTLLTRSSGTTKSHDPTRPNVSGSQASVLVSYQLLIVTWP